MPKRIDPKVKEPCVQQMLEHAAEYPSPTAVAEVVAKRNMVGADTVRRWYMQAQVESGHRRGATTEELAEIKELKAKVRRLEDDNDILRRATIFFAGELDPRDRCSSRSSTNAARLVLRSSWSAGSCQSRAVRSPHGPIEPGPAAVRWSQGARSVTRS